jgi:hypothetical protein
MKAIDIESWALRVLERIEKRLPVEDSKVELKADWPNDHAKAARRIAGHANAARGENILWLIGADEKQGIVTGANQQDLASWFPQVKACFESEVPVMQDLHIAFKDKIVTAMCFDTSRFPYLVKNPAGGQIQFEVPWRDSTGIRTATRGDLVLMVSPLVRLPKIEILQGRVEYTQSERSDVNYYACTLELYVVPLGGDCLTFPFHKVKTMLMGAGKVISEDFAIKMGSWTALADEHNMTLRGLSDRDIKRRLASENIQLTEDEVVIKAAGKVAILADTVGEHADVPDMHLSLTLVEAITEMQILLTADFKQIDLCAWKLISAKASSA